LDRPSKTRRRAASRSAVGEAVDQLRANSGLKSGEYSGPGPGLGVIFLRLPTQVHHAPAPIQAAGHQVQGLQNQNLSIEPLKAAIRAKLDQLVAANETRVDLR
jgi:hypothetical protein